MFIGNFLNFWTKYLTFVSQSSHTVMTTRVKIVEHVAINLVTTRVNVLLDLWEKIVKVELW